MNLQEVISKDMMCLELQAHDKDGVIAELAGLMHKAGRIADLDAFIEDVHKREALEVTALDNGVAIPHAKSDQVVKAAVCIARKQSGIDFGGDDAPPVKLFVMFAAGSAEGAHLKLLAKFARMLVYDEFIDELLTAKTADEMYASVLKYEEMIEKER